MSSAKAALADNRTPMATPDREAHTRMALIDYVLSEPRDERNKLNRVVGVIHLNRNVEERFRSNQLRRGAQKVPKTWVDLHSVT
jgi:hypothetical protein